MVKAIHYKRLNYTSLPSLLHRYDTMPRQLAFRARPGEEWSAWRETLHGKLVELLGGFPLERPALDPALLEVREEPDYRLEKVAFKTAYGDLQRIYELVDASERLDHDVFHGGHQFSGHKAFGWLERWLS